MPQLFANNAYSSLGATLSAVSTSLTLATGTGSRFPSPTGGDYFLLTLVGLDGDGNENAWEIVLVTGRASDALTVTRAQEGTTAALWPAGSRVEMRSTKGTFDSLVQNFGQSRLGVDKANYIQAEGALAGGVPSLSAQGSDANINLGLYGKGSGGVTMWSRGVIGFSVSNPASAVNYLAAVGSATGGGVTLGAAGSDANVTVAISAKGTGSVQAWSNGAAVFTASAPSSSVNYLGFLAAATGGSVSVNAYGSDANIGLALKSKGTGSVAISTNGTDRVTVDASGNTTFQASGSAVSNVSSVNGGPLAGFRNRIINGNFDIWQRGNSLASNQYAADRWITFTSGTVLNVAKADLAGNWPQIGGNTCLYVIGAAGNTGLTVAQRIESANVRDVNGRTCTASAWFFVATSQSVTMQVHRANAVDNFAATTVLATTSQTLTANTWTRLTVSCTPDANGLNGLMFSATLSSCVAGQAFYIASAQLEVGSVATPFEVRPYQTELALCQRYFQTTTFWARSYAGAAGAAIPCNLTLPVRMRVNPTVAAFTPTYVNCSAVAAQNGTSHSQAYAATATAIGDAYWYTANDAVQLSAEL